MMCKKSSTIVSIALFAAVAGGFVALGVVTAAESPAGEGSVQASALAAGAAMKRAAAKPLEIDMDNGAGAGDPRDETRNSAPPVLVNAGPLNLVNGKPADSDADRVQGSGIGPAHLVQAGQGPAAAGPMTLASVKVRSAGLQGAQPSRDSVSNGAATQPGTWALLIAGLLAVGAMVRKRF